MNLSSSDIVYFLFAAQANSVSLFICTVRGAKDLDPEAVAARFGFLTLCAILPKGRNAQLFFSTIPEDSHLGPSDINCQQNSTRLLKSLCLTHSSVRATQLSTDLKVCDHPTAVKLCVARCGGPYTKSHIPSLCHI